MRRTYQMLAQAQKQILQAYGRPLPLPDPDLLRGVFSRDKIASVPSFLPSGMFSFLRSAALHRFEPERVHLPRHKRGATVSYAALHAAAPEIVAFYLSADLHVWFSKVIGETIGPTPLNDQSSCSLLFYDRPQDHIQWHFDYNFYNGRHFTALLPLINEHALQPRLSSAELMARVRSSEFRVPTPPNTLILFEGAYVCHKVTPLGENERRVILSMTFTTDPTSTFVKCAGRRFKDIAYYGLRALWT